MGTFPCGIMAAGIDCSFQLLLLVELAPAGSMTGLPTCAAGYMGDGWDVGDLSPPCCWNRGWKKCTL